MPPSSTGLSWRHPVVIIIVDLGLGNMSSVRNMFKRVGVPTTSSVDRDEIIQASKIVLPGVGAFDTGMERLEQSGLIPMLTELAVDRRVPTLGICLGMQLMTERSEEGTRAGLGWVPGSTHRFRLEGTDLKVPHMGWNLATPTRPDTLFKDADPDARYYFVHSYHVVCSEEPDVLAWTEHGTRFASSFQRGTLFGTQFHPEKSHRFGMEILRNFAVA
jgi:glutamine amidotransferase